MSEGKRYTLTETMIFYDDRMCPECPYLHDTDYRDRYWCDKLHHSLTMDKRGNPVKDTNCPWELKENTHPNYKGSIRVYNKHYCKHCDYTFSIPEIETGDFFIVCPQCGYKHYRRFENGVAIHCELSKRKSEPVLIKSGD